MGGATTSNANNGTTSTTAGLRLGLIDAPSDWLSSSWTRSASSDNVTQSPYHSAFGHGGAGPLSLTGAISVVLLSDPNEDDRQVTDAIEAIGSQAAASDQSGSLASAIKAAASASNIHVLTSALSDQATAQTELIQTSLGAPVAARRLVLPESALAASLASVVFLVDASEEPYSEASDSLRGVTSLLLGLAQARWQQWADQSEATVLDSAGPAGLSASELASRANKLLLRTYEEALSASPTNPFHLPSLDVFVHKADGDAISGFGGSAGAASGSAGILGAGAGGASAEEARADLLRDVSGLISHELIDAGLLPSTGISGSSASFGRQGYPQQPQQQQNSSDGSPDYYWRPPPLPHPLPLPVAFYVTSLFDSDGGGGAAAADGSGSGGGGASSSSSGGGGGSSVLEALSRVVQRVAPGPQLAPAVEAMLDAVVQVRARDGGRACQLPPRLPGVGCIMLCSDLMMIPCFTAILLYLLHRFSSSLWCSPAAPAQPLTATTMAITTPPPPPHHHQPLWSLAWRSSIFWMDPVGCCWRLTATHCRCRRVRAAPLLCLPVYHQSAHVKAWGRIRQR